MRRPLIAANWKMFPLPEGALDNDSPYRERGDMDIVVFPTFLDIKECIHARLITGGQTGHNEPSGAHTGDVSMQHLADAGCRYVLCGHSERRAEHGETDEMVAAQVIAALESRMHPIVCVGETAAERKAGTQHAVIERQMSGLPLASDLTVAYEPVWAISGGDTSTKAATPEDAEEMHAFIRSLLPEEKREATRILYGGSVKPENAAALFAQPDIDGGLVGAASLDPAAFQSIVEAASA